MRVRSSGRHLLAGDFADGDDAFHGRGVRQLRHARDDVADGVDVRLVGLHVRPDVHEAALDFRARLFQAEIARSSARGPRRSARARPTAFAPAPALSRNATVALRRRSCHRFDLGFGENLDAALAEGLLELGGNFFVFERHHARQHLEDGDLRCRRNWKIEANSTPTAPAPTITSDFGTSGSFRMSRLPTITLPSNSTPGSERASEPVANMMCVASTSVILPSFSTATRPGPAQRPQPCMRLHFVLAEEKFDAFGVLVDDLVLARQHRRPIQLELGDLDAELLGVLEVVVDFRVMQQHLGGDAADVQAGAARGTRLSR